jgi:glycosyltransferase involved in cell wall biosynthesis
MQGRLRPPDRPPGTTILEAADALRALEATTDRPILLGYHPVARLNPFQALLYREAWDAGIAPIPIVAEEAIEELGGLVPLGVPVVLHLHWLHHPRPDAERPDAAEADADAFLARIDRFLGDGGRLVWTVHNILPHVAGLDRTAARVHQAIADRASVVHVLAAETAAYVAPTYRLPAERILHVPHPSYAGAYPVVAGRAQARHELGFQPDELVFLVSGAIQPYKGIGDLLDAWESLPVSPLRRLVIVGSPADDLATAAVLERATLHPTVSLHARKLPPELLALFLEAADVAVLPYVRSLNSGVLMLALTFGLPVIVPSPGPLADAVEPSYARTYDRSDPESLRRALLQAGDLLAPAVRAAARAAAAARDPVLISRAFARGLRERLDGGDGTDRVGLDDRGAS